jgi:hypothetical protein
MVCTPKGVLDHTLNSSECHSKSSSHKNIITVEMCNLD